MPRITNIPASTRADLRYAVQLAVQHWPNAHLGDCSPREDIRSAFKRIRVAAERGSLQSAIGEVELDAHRHANM